MILKEQYDYFEIRHFFSNRLKKRSQDFGDLKINAQFTVMDYGFGL